MRFYDDMCVFSVDLKALDFGAASGGQHAVPTTPLTIDITSQLGAYSPVR
jgi:hypothetical protein